MKRMTNKPKRIKSTQKIS